MAKNSRIWFALVLLGLASVAAPARSQGKRRRASQSAAVKTEFPAKPAHPKIRVAIASLEAAKTELAASKTDFGGHKQDALDAVDQALKRLRLALQFEKY